MRLLHRVMSRCCVLAILMGSGIAWATSVIDRIEILSNLPGASGYEKPVRQYLINELSKKDLNKQIDGMGNLIVRLGTHDPNKKTILLMAHMDEIGFVIKEIDERGYIYVMPLGGWVSHVLWSQSWSIQLSNGEISAISGIDPPHVLTDFSKPPELNASQFFLDTGLERKSLLAKGVRPGLSVVPKATFKKLGRFYQGKALDDRLGVALLLDLIEKLSDDQSLQKQFNLAFAFTTQEELGMRGAKVVTASVKPDIVFNVDAGIAHDYPMQFTQEKGPKLGGGPSLFVYDGSMIPNPALVEFMASIAKKNKIPFQWEHEISYGQDGSSLQQSGHGSAVVNIGIPMRYVHSPIGLFQLSDLDATRQLLLKSIQSLSEYTKDFNAS